MFSRITRPLLLCAKARPLPPGPLFHATRDAVTHRRFYSALQTHSSFPATLLRLNAGVVFKPLPCERQVERDQRRERKDDDDDEDEDSGDWTNYLPLGRATLMPNTGTTQEVIRMAADNYIDAKESGVGDIECPHLFIIPKGTVLPPSLVLLRDEVSKFCLQPSRPTSPDDFNTILKEFYSTYADKQDFRQWLDKHEYHEAFDDSKEREWMAV